MQRRWPLLFFALVVGLGALPAAYGQGIPARQSSLLGLLPAEAILLGEQHDARQHQLIEAEVVQWLAQRGLLAALVLEMAEASRSTQGLPNQADESSVRAALDWQDAAWPWANYGPAVMAAVQAGVPILGGNLPQAEMRQAMQNSALDGVLRGPALKAQQQAIRIGHCNLLPEAQIAPMTRIQLARDQRMAQVIQGATMPSKVVLLVAGAGHVDRQLGIAQHLPENFKLKVVIAQANLAPGASDSVAPGDARADALWLTQALPEKDYCADFLPKR
jgi:uncharacterized iron-regulated protein